MMMGFNRVMVWLLRSPFHWLISRSILALRVIGVKSGKPYEIPVNYVIVELLEGARCLITSQRDRTWWRNLRNRVEVELFFKGKRVLAKAQAFESFEDVADGLTKYFKASPRSARYFNLELNEDGNVPEADLERIAKERVVIWVEPPTTLMSE
jgi:hypothetical protein